VVEGKTLAVVVPAYNEELLAVDTLRGIPDIVDRVYLVDDRSSDATVERVREYAVTDPRVQLIVHEQNGGVGKAICTGYKAALADSIDLVAVMAADNQMDPDELERFAHAVAVGDCDYAKANRLTTGEAFEQIPKVRYFGNAILSLFTKIASGYWHIADSQAGYAVISREALATLPLDRLYPRYGFPNDVLVHLNVDARKVRDLPSRPIYGIGERSGIRLRKVVPTIGALLFRRFWWRLWARYVVRDFHPLVFFYTFGAILTTLGLLLGLLETIHRIGGTQVPTATIVLVALLVISGFQSLLFAMWFDMDYNRSSG
jgi:glycosyltransferase involved in cell wall biosynthesis